MKKITSVLALLLCILMLFASCGSDKPLKLDNDVLNMSKVVTNLALSELTSIGEGYTYKTRNTDLALFSKVLTDTSSTNFKVVNLKTNAVVMDKTFTATDISEGNVSLSLSSKGTFIVLYQNKTYTLFKADGVTAIGSSSTAPKYVNDCAVIGDTVCRYDVETYEIEETFNYPSLNGAIPTAPSYGYSNFYVSKTDNGFTVYDLHYNYIGEYILPEYAYDAVSCVLKNGNVFVQYLVALPFDAEEYDIFDEGEKFDLVQKIVSAKDLSEKEIELDYYVSGISPINSDADGYFFKKSIDNLASCYKIENGQYDENASVMLSFTNKGKTSLLYDERYLQYRPIGNGYLIGTTKNEMSVILDAKLNVVSKLSGVTAVTEKYIVTSTAVYDYTFTKLADLSTSAITYTVKGTIGCYPVFTAYDDTNKTDYFVFDGAFTKIADASEGQTFSGDISSKISLPEASIYFGEYGASLYTVSTTTETVPGTSVTTTRIYKADKTELASYTDTVSFVNDGYGNDQSFIIKVGQKYIYVSEAEASK